MEANELFCREIADSFCEPDSSENETDALLAVASVEYESTKQATPHRPLLQVATPTHSPKPSPTPNDLRFRKLRTTFFAVGIPETTKYCVSIWDAWSTESEQTTHTHIPSLSTMTVAQLRHWMTRFILEARKKNGDPYPPNSLHHIVTGLMRHLRWSGRVIDFFKDSNFIDFRASLDSEMKTPEYCCEVASGGNHGGG